jgi:hypothetical protein
MNNSPGRTTKTQKIYIKTWMTFLRICRTLRVKRVQIDAVMIKRRRFTMTTHIILQKQNKNGAAKQTLERPESDSFT